MWTRAVDTKSLPGEMPAAELHVVIDPWNTTSEWIPMTSLRSERVWRDSMF